MANYEGLQAGLAIYGAGALISIGILSVTDIPFESRIIICVANALCFAAFGTAYLGIKRLEPKKDDPPIKLELKYPQVATLELRPLKHYKGYMLPPKVEMLPDTPDGKHSANITNVGDSTVEYSLLERSQKLEVITDILTQPKELIAKFGVVRVRCISGDALNCRAQLRVRLIEMYGQIHLTNFVDWGYLNWFSVAIKHNIQQNKFNDIYPSKHLGLNKYLLNTSVDLHQGEEKDLLLFYMIKDLPNVYLCTDVEIAHAGSVFASGQTLKFEVEISLAAQGYPKNTWTYFVTIDDFDNYKIERG